MSYERLPIYGIEAITRSRYGQSLASIPGSWHRKHVGKHIEEEHTSLT